MKESITSTLGGDACALLLSSQADVTGKNQTPFCRTRLNFFDITFFLLPRCLVALTFPDPMVPYPTLLPGAWDSG